MVKVLSNLKPVNTYNIKRYGAPHWQFTFTSFLRVWWCWCCFIINGHVVWWYFVSFIFSSKTFIFPIALLCSVFKFMWRHVYYSLNSSRFICWYTTSLVLSRNEELGKIHVKQRHTTKSKMTFTNMCGFSRNIFHWKLEAYYNVG